MGPSHVALAAIFGSRVVTFRAEGLDGKEEGVGTRRRETGLYVKRRTRTQRDQRARSLWIVHVRQSLTELPIYPAPHTADKKAPRR